MNSLKTLWDYRVQSKFVVNFSRSRNCYLVYYQAQKFASEIDLFPFIYAGVVGKQTFSFSLIIYFYDDD